MSHNIPKGGQQNVGPAYGDLKYAKCYYPYKIYKGLKWMRLIITMHVKHRRLYGYAEGGHEYYPLVGYSIYAFVL